MFDNQGGRTVACMVHQPVAPGSRYTDPQRRDTAQVLTLLHYYTVKRAQALLRRAATQHHRPELGQALRRPRRRSHRRPPPAASTLSRPPTPPMDGVGGRRRSTVDAVGVRWSTGADGVSPFTPERPV